MSALSSHPVRKSDLVMDSALEKTAAMTRYERVVGVNLGKASIGDVVIAFLLQCPIEGVCHTAIRIVGGGEQA